jgi:hypothetical protein
MAFELLGKALRGASSLFSGLRDEVGNGRTDREDDVVDVKRGFGALGRFEEPEDGPNGIIDRPLDATIRGFQRDRGLRVDGFMRPGGPTERSLQHDLRGSSRRDTSAGLEPDPLRWPGRGGAESSSILGSGRSREREPGLSPVADATEPEPARLRPALGKMERNLRRTVEGWREQGMTDAARHLEHFLDGSGERIIYNRDQARSFSPVRNAEEDARAQLRKGILERARGLKDGEVLNDVVIEVTGGHGPIRHGLDLLRGFFGDADRFNDNLATGRTTVESTFKGTIRRNGDQISTEGAVGYDWKDRYDFHARQPGGGAAVNVQKYRGAKPFGFGGSWQQRLSGQIERRGNRLLPRLDLSDID